MVKNLPVVQEIRIQSLSWEDPLEKEKATHSNILCQESIMHRGAWWATWSWDHKRVGCDIVAHQAPLSLGFPRQEYWSGLPFPFPGDLPDPGMELRSLAWSQADSLPTEPPGKSPRWRWSWSPSGHGLELGTDCCVLPFPLESHHHRQWRVFTGPQLGKEGKAWKRRKRLETATCLGVCGCHLPGGSRTLTSVFCWLHLRNSKEESYLTD